MAIWRGGKKKKWFCCGKYFTRELLLGKHRQEALQNLDVLGDFCEMYWPAVSSRQLQSSLKSPQLPQSEQGKKLYYIFFLSHDFSRRRHGDNLYYHDS